MLGAIASRAGIEGLECVCGPSGGSACLGGAEERRLSRPSSVTSLAPTLGQHEVTIDQFRRFVELSGFVPESVADGTRGYGYNLACDPASSARTDDFEGRHPRHS